MRPTGGSVRPRTRLPPRRAATCCSFSIPTRAPRASRSLRSLARFRGRRARGRGRAAPGGNGRRCAAGRNAAPGSARARGPVRRFRCAACRRWDPTPASCFAGRPPVAQQSRRGGASATPTRIATPRFAVEQAAAAALAVRRDAFRRAAVASTRRYVPAWFEDVDLCARLAAGGDDPVPGRGALPAPRAASPHRGLGYARFLPTFYRNALRYRRDRYGLAARADVPRPAREGNAAAALLLLPFRADVPRPRPEAGARLPRRAAAWPSASAVRMPPDVSIIVVSNDDAADLPISLGSAVAQRGVACETIVVDNALPGRLARVPAQFGGAVRLLAHARERRVRRRDECRHRGHGGPVRSRAQSGLPSRAGFCGDARAAARRRGRPDVGSASGRLLRARRARSFVPPTCSTRPGIVFTRPGRHFDRGAGKSADGRYLREEEIAGTTGRPASTAARRSRRRGSRPVTSTPTSFSIARTPTSPGGCRKLGWKCLYVPAAVACAPPAQPPERRRRMSALANLHSVKNRFLLRINNQTGGAVRSRRCVPTLARDLVVLGACLTVERTSLPAFGWLWRNRKRLWAKRREIQAKVRARSVRRRASPGPAAAPGEGTLSHLSALQSPSPPNGGRGSG